MARSSCDLWNREVQCSELRRTGDQIGRWATIEESVADSVRAPIPSYSKRASLLAQLRARRSWALANADEDICPPSDDAVASAKAFINSLPDGCLSIRFALSQRGEINFFAGNDPRLLQILIDESGALSYYGEADDGPIAADSIAVDAFPHMRLFKFV